MLNSDILNEDQLARQGEQIAEVNERLSGRSQEFRVLRSVELNFSPEGAGDMDPAALRKLEVVLGCFYSALRRRKIKRTDTSPLYATPRFIYLVIRAGAFTTSV
ncbi:MAG: hypothetical protein DMG78_00245 [Acidobacteria bacterium]|nr:MAG: hypothetical protein DMG78_00245 [Acidobacteriota bacterium]